MTQRFQHTVTLVERGIQSHVDEWQLRGWELVAVLFLDDSRRELYWKRPYVPPGAVTAPGTRGSAAWPNQPDTGYATSGGPNP
jgi:hypothetical protein